MPQAQVVHSSESTHRDHPRRHAPRVTDKQILDLLPADKPQRKYLSKVIASFLRGMLRMNHGAAQFRFTNRAIARYTRHKCPRTVDNRIADLKELGILFEVGRVFKRKGKRKGQLDYVVRGLDLSRLRPTEDCVQSPAKIAFGLHEDCVAKTLESKSLEPSSKANPPLTLTCKRIISLPEHTERPTPMTISAFGDKTESQKQNRFHDLTAALNRIGQLQRQMETLRGTFEEAKFYAQYEPHLAHLVPSMRELEQQLATTQQELTEAHTTVAALRGHAA